MCSSLAESLKSFISITKHATDARNFNDTTVILLLSELNFNHSFIRVDFVITVYHNTITSAIIHLKTLNNFIRKSSDCFEDCEIFSIHEFSNIVLYIYEH